MGQVGAVMAEVGEMQDAAVEQDVRGRTKLDGLAEWILGSTRRLVESDDRGHCTFSMSLCLCGQ